MALDKTDIEYIKNTIEWLNEHTELIDSNRTNCEMLYNSVQNSLQALESALAECSNEEKATLPINSVSFSTADSALNMSTEERERRSAEQRHLLRGSRAEVCFRTNCLQHAVDNTCAKGIDYKCMYRQT